MKAKKLKAVMLTVVDAQIAGSRDEALILKRFNQKELNVIRKFIDSFQVG